MREVELTPSEYSMAAYVGQRRHVNSLLRGRTDYQSEGNKDRRWGNDVEAALAECAVCKLFGVFWNGNMMAPDNGDIGRTEVKVARQGDRLIVQPKNRTDAPYVLVWGWRGRVYTVVGWIWGHEAKETDLFDPNGGMPAHFIDPDSLYPMEDFPVEYLE